MSRAVGFALMCLIVNVAYAQPRVVIVETLDAPSLPALATQVRVHAGREVEVTTITRPETSIVFASHASEVVVAANATVTVWVATVDPEPDRTDAPRVFLVYAAGRWPGRAMIELVRIDTQTPAGEVERTIALKIAALLDSILTPQPAASVLDIPVAAPHPSSRSASTRRWMIAFGGSLVREQGARRWDGRVMSWLARRWDVRAWSLGARVGVHWQPTSVIDGSRGSVLVQELAASAGATLARPLGRWSPMIGGHVTAAALHARGVTLDARRGSATVGVPYVGADVGIRHSISAAIDLVLEVEIDVALIRQRFLLDGSITADVQRLRGTITLGASIAL